MAEQRRGVGAPSTSHEAIGSSRAHINVAIRELHRDVLIEHGEIAVDQVSP